MSTHLVSLGCTMREQVRTPPILFTDPFAIVSEHFKVGEVVWDMCLVKSVMAVCLLPLE